MKRNPRTLSASELALIALIVAVVLGLLAPILALLFSW